jgi:hypothetical protein
MTVEEWATALRSGEFLQCKGVMSDSTVKAFCCLGVGQELLKKEEIYQSIFSFCDREFLPVEGLYFTSHLITMNDFARNSFSEIADFIESAPRRKPGQLVIVEHANG